MSKKSIAIVAVIAIIAILGVVLCACNASDYTKKLEKKGYTVSSYENDGEDARVLWTVSGYKSNGVLSKGDTVTITKYADKNDAENAYNDALKLADNNKKCVYRVGNIVITGTEQGVKDAK